MTEDYEWLKKLKVGDEVGVDDSDEGNTRVSIGKVSAVTPSGYILVGDNLYGAEGGSKLHNKGPWGTIVQVDEARATMEVVAVKEEIRAILDKITSAYYPSRNINKLRDIRGALLATRLIHMEGGEEE